MTSAELFFFSKKGKTLSCATTEEEMFNFFPNGIRVLLVDDDPKFVKSATMMLSLLQFKVATCSGPSSALRLLTCAKVKDVDVVLADAHQVSAGGFDLCAIVELDLGIPVIYFMSPESPDQAAAAAVATATDEKSSLDRIVQSATLVIKKPLDVGELRTLWRVVAWRKCFLDARKAKACVIGGATPLWMEDQRVHYKEVRPGGGGGRRNNNRHDSSDAGSSETQKHRIMWTPCLKQKFEHAVKSIGIGGHPSEILDHMNVKGLRRHHVASYLQKYRAKLRNKNNARGNAVWNSSPYSDDNRPKESPFTRCSFPMPNIAPYNSQIFTGGGGPSTGAVAEDFLSSWLPSFQHPDRNVSSSSAVPVAIPAGQQPSSVTEASNVPPADFTGNVVPTVRQWPAMFQQPTKDVSSIITLVEAMQTEKQLSSGASQGTLFPQMFFGSSGYQGPFPLNTFGVQGEVQQQQQQQQLQGDAVIQPLYQQSMADQIAGATAGAAVAATTEANEAALIEAFVSNTQFVAPDHGTSAAAEEQEAAAMVAEMLAAPENGPAVASDGDGDLGPMVIAADEGFTLDQLESLLGAPMDTDRAAAYESNGFLNGEEGGTGGWDLGTDQGSVFLEEIFRDNTGFQDETGCNDWDL